MSNTIIDRLRLSVVHIRVFWIILVNYKLLLEKFIWKTQFCNIQKMTLTQAIISVIGKKSCYLSFRGAGVGRYVNCGKSKLMVLRQFYIKSLQIRSYILMLLSQSFFESTYYIKRRITMLIIYTMTKQNAYTIYKDNVYTIIQRWRTMLVIFETPEKNALFKHFNEIPLHDKC